MKYIDFKNKIRELPVFSAALLGSMTPHRATLKVQLSHWKKKGLILSLRKGLYVLSSDDRVLEPSLFFLAGQIFMPSYVSLESALSNYGMIPEFVGAATSITARKTCKFKNEFGIFTYQHVKSEFFTGFTPVQEGDKMSFLMASPEKAVADFLYLNLEKFAVDDRDIFEKSYRFQNCRQLALVKLRQYAALSGNKKMGWVMDLFIKAVCK